MASVLTVTQKFAGHAKAAGGSIGSESGGYQPPSG
jgi:hypothetical protein